LTIGVLGWGDGLVLRTGADSQSSAIIIKRKSSSTEKVLGSKVACGDEGALAIGSRSSGTRFILGTGAGAVKSALAIREGRSSSGFVLLTDNTNRIECADCLGGSGGRGGSELGGGVTSDDVDAYWLSGCGGRGLLVLSGEIAANNSDTKTIGSKSGGKRLDLATAADRQKLALAVCGQSRRSGLPLIYSTSANVGAATI